MNRRKFIGQLYQVALAHSAGTCLCLSALQAASGQPPGGPAGVRGNSPPGPEPSKVRKQVSKVNSSILRGACSISSASAKGFFEEFQPIQSSSNYQIDQIFTQEIISLMEITGYRPSFMFFDDRSGGNAFATPAIIDPARPSRHGSVAFGLRLLSAEITDYLNVAYACILAHEWTHIVQQQIGLRAPTYKKELMADMVAGWYIRAKYVFGGKFFDPNTAMRSLYDKGDYQFNSPSHHGTPDQRVTAFVIGYNSIEYGHYNFTSAFNFAAQQTGCI